MNTDKSLIDDILLDRLVDGELSSTERRQLLESFDKQPEGWRRCALAFLEAQSWREELGQVARDRESKTAEPVSPVSSLPSVARKSPWMIGAAWLAVAAGLLIAFGLGWKQRERGISVADNAAKSTEQVAAVNPSGQSAKQPTNAKPGDAVTLFVRDDAGHMQPVRVPLVDANTLDKQLGMQFQTGVSDNVRSELKNNGYAVHSKRQYAPLWLENGRPMILPVEDTKIVPVSNRIY